MKRIEIILLFISIAMLAYVMIKSEEYRYIDRTQQIIDSMKVVANNAAIAANDSTIDVYKQELTALNKSSLKQARINADLKAELKKIRVDYAPADTMLTLCDTLVKVQDSIIVGQQIELDTCHASIGVAMSMYYKSLDSNFLLSDNIRLKDSQISNAQKQIDNLIRSNKRTWFERNKGWLGLGAGAAATYILFR